MLRTKEQFFLPAACCRSSLFDKMCYTERRGALCRGLELTKGETEP